MTINPDSQTFGIEIETAGISLRAAAEAVRSVTGGTAAETEDYDECSQIWTVTAPDGRIWKAAPDSSITPELGDPEMNTAEIVSPVCRASDIPAVQAVVRALKAAGAKVNDSCGIHVHVGVPGVTGRELACLVKTVNRQEEYLFEALGVLTSRQNQYAQQVDPDLMDRLASQKPQTLCQFKKAWYHIKGNKTDEELAKYDFGHYHHSRYHGLNLHAVFTKGTVEYRYFNGSLNDLKVKAYIQFCMALTAHGLTRQAAKSGRREFKAASARYDFRIFLTQIGLNGDKNKTCRDVMLARLGGDAAYKNGRPLAMAA